MLNEQDEQGLEGAILRAWKQASRRAEGFGLLVKHYSSRLYVQIDRVLLDAHATDEVLQNTLIKAYRGLDSFRAEAKLSTWLHSIARNETWTYLQKRKKLAYSSLDEAALRNMPSMLSDEGPSSQEIEAVLADALASLPEKQRLVFERRYYQEQSYKEMAAELQTSEGALKASYHHAVKKIEAYIKLYCNEG